MLKYWEIFSLWIRTVWGGVLEDVREKDKTKFVRENRLKDKAV